MFAGAGARVIRSYVAPGIALTGSVAFVNVFMHDFSRPWGAMKILFVASEGLPYSKTGGLADVVEALPKALCQMGHEVAVLLPRYHGQQGQLDFDIERERRAGRRAAISRDRRGAAAQRSALFFRERPGIFRAPEHLRRQERRLSGQRRALHGVLARGDRVYEARLAARRGSLPRLANGADSFAAAHAACRRSGGAVAAGGADDSQSRAIRDCSRKRRCEAAGFRRACSGWMRWNSTGG